MLIGLVRVIFGFLGQSQLHPEHMVQDLGEECSPEAKPEWLPGRKTPTETEMPLRLITNSHSHALGNTVERESGVSEGWGHEKMEVLGLLIRNVTESI